MLEEQGALAEAEAAYRRADQRGDAEGAFRLGVLLRQRGELYEAAVAYGRASSRGISAADLDLGVMLAENGELAEAEVAFGRADEGGDAVAAFISAFCSRIVVRSPRPRRRTAGPMSVAMPTGAPAGGPAEEARGTG